MQGLTCSVFVSWVLTFAMGQPAIAQQASPAGSPEGSPQKAAAAATAARFTGRVVAYDGSPLSGVAIACATKRLSTAELLQQPTTTTDANGHFAISATKQAEGSLEVLHLQVAKAGMAAVARALDLEKPALDDIVLTAGQRLFGRVRTVDGTPLPGVLVTATDLLEQGAMFRSGPPNGFHCTAISDGTGIFQLPCALATGARLELHRDGYARTWLEPVAAGTPLEVTLRESGWIQGRVLDREGHGIDDATVTVSYELRAANPPVRTGADGSFRVPVDRLGRWRITASKRIDRVLMRGHSEVLTGPRANLEIIAEAPEAVATKTFLIRAVHEKGGAVPALRAVALWEPYANQNTSYREYRFRMLLKNATETAGNTAEVAGPAPNGHGTGIVRVIADGFAPATVTDVEWQELEEKRESSEPLLVELQPEATVRGFVRDEGTGLPIPGARVRARHKPAANEGHYPDNDTSDAVVTAADGSFELRGLGAGAWNLHALDDKHPNVDPVAVDLAAGEQRTEITITMPSGAVVAGKLEGIAADYAARVFLAGIPRQVFGEAARFFGSASNQSEDRVGIPVAADGRFEFTGVSLANHQLVVRLPSEPRLGGDLYLPIEPFRVRAAGIDRVFDCRGDQPGFIRGKIRFSHASAAFEHLVVVAQQNNGQGRAYFSPYNQRFPGPRAFVGRDGAFALRVGPGDYDLVVVDLRSSVALHSEEDVVSVGTGKTAERDLTLPLKEITLTLAPAEDVAEAEMATIERVEVRFVPKAFEKNARAAAGNEQYDSRTGIYWPPGTESLSLALPEGSVTFFGRNEIGSIRIDDKRNNNAPLGRAELEVTIGGETTLPCPLEVTARPDVIDPKDGKGQEQNGDEAQADGVLRK